MSSQPKPTPVITDCANGHDYKPTGRPYFKRDGTNLSAFGILPRYDQSVSYATLYCSHCGATIEIIAARH